MRQVCFLFTGLVCLAAPALAQVTVDLHALDALPGARLAPSEAPTPRPKPKPAPKRVAVAKPKPRPPAATAAIPAPAAPAATTPKATTPPPETATTAPAAPAPAPTPVPPAPPAATLPNAPPPNVALAPIAPPPPTEQPAPPPPPPVSSTSSSAATATGAGLRVTFGGGEADLSPTSADAIKKLVQTAPSGDGTTFNVVAYAAGTPEDPSTARRLSLSRALAVRSALMADGVTSTHIYVRALGAPEGDATPDRVDVAVMGSNAPPATSANAPAPPTAGGKSQSP
jgi:outer membrane protein OmpA-like peptidoglycan-associated protein